MASKPRFVIGSKNKQYGLIKRKKSGGSTGGAFGGFALKKKSPALKRKANALGGKKAPLAVFQKAAAEDSHAVDTIELERAYKKSRYAEVDKMHKEALEQDATVFDYDAWAEKEGSNRRLYGNKEKRDGSSGKGQSKYMEVMMKNAQKRLRVNDRAYERKLLREREEDEHLYGHKEKFVTTAYKAKLEEDARVREEERLAALKERDVNKGGLTSFYAGLLNNNAGLGARRGGATASHAGTAVAGAEEDDAGAGGATPPADSAAPAAAKAEAPHAGAASDAGAGSGSGSAEAADVAKAAGKPEVGAAEAAMMAAVREVKSEATSALSAEEKKAAAKLKREQAKKAARERYLARKAAKAKAT